MCKKKSQQSENAAGKAALIWISYELTGEQNRWRRKDECTEESWQSFDVKGLNIITDANMPHGGAYVQIEAK